MEVVSLVIGIMEYPEKGSGSFQRGWMEYYTFDSIGLARLQTRHCVHILSNKKRVLGSDNNLVWSGRHSLKDDYPVSGDRIIQYTCLLILR